MGIVSPHLHQIVGGNAFDIGMSLDNDLPTMSTCTTCTYSEDFSNYWTAVLYFKHQNGTYQRVPQRPGELLGAANGGMTLYYMQPTNGGKVTSFKKGFRMIVGDPMLRSFNSSSGDANNLNFRCLSAGGGNGGTSGAPGTDTRNLPAKPCAGGIRSEIVFPSCWDGVNLDTPNHRSHMAYPANGKCPSTHPVTVPTIFIETIWDTPKFNNMWPSGAAQPFVYSMGDPTGYGQHADYVFGWKGDALQRAMDQCNSFGGACPTLKTQSIDAINRCTQKTRVRETVEGALAALPGCNPEQPGPARATMVPNCSATKDYDADGGPKGGSPAPPAATTPNNPPPGSTTVVEPPASSTSAPPFPGVPHYGQCGGMGWSGPTVGGHAGVMTTEDGSLLIKPALKQELAFYQRLQSDPSDAFRALRQYTPNFLGTLTLEGEAAGSTEDGNLQIKPVGERKDESISEVVHVGTVLYDDSANEEKVARMIKTAKETTSLETGVRLTGFQVYDNSTGVAVNTPKSYGKSIKPSDLPDGIARFFPAGDDEGSTNGLPKKTLIPILESIRSEIAEIRDALSKLEFRMVGGSVLIIYEADWERAEAAIKHYLESSTTERDDAEAENEDDEEEDSDEDEENAHPPAFSVKLIDFAHTKVQEGLGPDDGDLAIRKTMYTLPSSTVPIQRAAWLTGPPNSWLVRGEALPLRPPGGVEVPDVLVKPYPPSQQCSKGPILNKRIDIGAIHDSEQQSTTVGCTPGTREPILRTVTNWIGTNNRRIAWVTGFMGTGKTAILCTMAERCQQNGTLAASFFSSSSLRRDLRTLLPTIIYQLSTNEILAKDLGKDLRLFFSRNPDIFERNLESQADRLLRVFRPKAQASAHQRDNWPKLIIIDGIETWKLEEGMDPHEAMAKQYQVLHTLLKLARDDDFPFLFLVGSRQEAAIVNFFQHSAPDISTMINLNELLHRYPSHGGLDDDIGVYCESKLKEIYHQQGIDEPAAQDRALRISLSVNACFDERVKLIIEAGGYFAYASRAIEFIGNGSQSPQVQLQLVLEVNEVPSWPLMMATGSRSEVVVPPPEAAPFTGLDDMYNNILNLSPDPLKAAQVIRMVRIPILGSELPAYFWRHFFNSSPAQSGFRNARRLLDPLRPLMEIPEANDKTTPFLFCHPSFIRFLRKRFKNVATLPDSDPPDWDYDCTRLCEQIYWHIVARRSFSSAEPIEQKELLDWLLNIQLRFMPEDSCQGDRARCDPDWWVRQNISRKNSNNVREAFRSFHEKCPWYWCTPLCVSWRGAILSRCKAEGWSLPDMTRSESLWARYQDSGPNSLISYDNAFNPPSTPRVPGAGSWRWSSL
ncbi:hypothetical protein NMY22_g11926 [Coprinellus aureogranulatus]|nr:hypothetical protein NMY22_g11926 [Coprinellus aureogranulatus]